MIRVADKGGILMIVMHIRQYCRGYHDIINTVEDLESLPY